MYYLIELRFNRHVSTESVPLGFNGPVVSGVEVTYLPCPEEWSDGEDTPQGPVLGISTTNCKVFRVFESEKECRNGGFESLGTKYEFRI